MTSVGSPVGNLPHTELPYRSSTTAQTSGANPPGKLWLPIWSGEVINAYDEFNQFESMVTSRTIPSGTTIEIPITGTVDLQPSWDAGQELVGQSGTASTATTFKLTLDNRPMAAHFEIDNIDLMLTQWEFRSELARQAALQLANTRDKQIYAYLCKAAVTLEIGNDPRPDMGLASKIYGGTTVDDFGLSTASATSRATASLVVLEQIEKFIVHLQEANVPYDRLYLAVTPQAFMDIRALGVARQSSDLDDGGRQLYFGGNASASSGTGLGGPLNYSYGQLQDTLEYMGCTIIKSNHTNDRTDLSGGNTLGQNKYNLDFLNAKIRGVMWTPECLGAIRLQGLKVDTVDDVRRNTTFTVASMMSGTGVLRPECAGIITALDIDNVSYNTRDEIETALDAAADGQDYAEA